MKHPFDYLWDVFKFRFWLNNFFACVNNVIGEKFENQHPCHFLVLLHLWLRLFIFRLKQLILQNPLENIWQAVGDINFFKSLHSSVKISRIKFTEFNPLQFLACRFVEVMTFKWTPEVKGLTIATSTTEAVALSCSVKKVLLKI